MNHETSTSGKRPLSLQFNSKIIPPDATLPIYRPLVRNNLASFNIIFSLGRVVNYLLDHISRRRQPDPSTTYDDRNGRRRWYTLQKATAALPPFIDVLPTAVSVLISRLTIASTYHLYAGIINNHEKIPSPPVVDLVAPWLTTDNAPHCKLERRVRDDSTDTQSVNNQTSITYDVPSSASWCRPVFLFLTYLL